ncbi:hypothetical protein BaRGS_00026424 [Batillaria attramentaria]|uniref:Secreted protein n=1 Tax=Batillaria attramentaria TaxID=370345 RepID=A0ABD0K654_9CAEN
MYNCNVLLRPLLLGVCLGLHNCSTEWLLGSWLIESRDFDRSFLLKVHIWRSPVYVCTQQEFKQSVVITHEQSWQRKQKNKTANCIISRCTHLKTETKSETILIGKLLTIRLLNAVSDRNRNDGGCVVLLLPEEFFESLQV